MKNPSKAERILDYLKNNPGRRKTAEIAKAIGVSVNGTSPVLTELVSTGEITKIKQGTYTANDNGNPSAATQTPPTDDLKQISGALRSPDANKNTIDKLMNLYDKHVERYTQWFDKSVDDDTDFEQCQFIENFKGLTAIGDKLMKRWALEHVGYDTNTRQAQEDAKAKTEERQKAALEDAPLKDRIVVVGKYDPRAEKLIDCIPSSLEETSLEEMTDEETEKAKV